VGGRILERERAAEGLPDQRDALRAERIAQRIEIRYEQV
jgi:hypothetical protein